MTDYKHDIEKYLKGELTPAQMHALEKKALSDPFLADALEGVQSLKPEEFLEDLSKLQGSLHSRIQKKNEGRWIWIGRIAAGLLLLAVSTFFIVLISNRSEEKADNLALNKQEEESSSPQKSDAHGPVVDSTSVHEDDALSSQVPAPEESKKEAPIPLEKPAAVRRQEEARADIQEAQEQLGKTDTDEEHLAVDEAEDIQLEENLVFTEPNEVQPAPRVTEQAELKREKLDEGVGKSARDKSATGAQTLSDSYNVNRKIIRGRVTYSDDGTGLPGVNVIIKGTNEGTVTDAQGYYQIPVKEAQPTLLFSFIGFENKEIEAHSEKVNVQLEADVSALSEVVVVGYGSKDIEFLPSTPTVMELAMPEGGRKVFKQYLEKNVRYPEEALKNKVEGKVTIQFIIGTSGLLTDFKVIRGIGYGCEDEVIRLIKAGPKWAPTKKNEVPIKDRVRVRMRFALPKK
jgi:TonB family protein